MYFQSFSGPIMHMQSTKAISIIIPLKDCKVYLYIHRISLQVPLGCSEHSHKRPIVLNLTMATGLSLFAENCSNFDRFFVEPVSRIPYAQNTSMNRILPSIH